MGILDSETPKVTLIQGPPGTGKSQTIDGHVRLLIYPQVSSLSKSEQANPILVCAPSNTAVDQLLLRVANAAWMTPKLRKRLYRVGRLVKVAPKARKFIPKGIVGFVEKQPSIVEHI